MDDLDAEYWDDEDDEDYTYGCDEDGWYQYDPETTCIVCGSSDCVDQCECCGSPLCHMHSELGVGFCPSCPTQTYWPEYMPETFTDKLRGVFNSIKNLFTHRAPIVYFSDEEIPF